MHEQSPRAQYDARGRALTDAVSMCEQSAALVVAPARVPVGDTALLHKEEEAPMVYHRKCAPTESTRLFGTL